MKPKSQSVRETKPSISCQTTKCHELPNLFIALLRAAREVTLDGLRVTEIPDGSNITITPIRLERCARTGGGRGPTEFVPDIKSKDSVTTIIEVDVGAQSARANDAEVPRETVDEEEVDVRSEADVCLAFLFAPLVVPFGVEVLVALAVHNDGALVDVGIVVGDRVHIVAVNVEWEMKAAP